MTATYMQVRDVLNVATKFHRTLQDFYNQLAEQADRDRVQILLDLMRRHEEDFEKARESYDREGSKRLLDTWMQYAPNGRSLEVPQPEALRDDMTVDDVVEVALRLDEKLVQFYADAARMAKVPEVRHLFEELVRRREGEQARLKTDARLLKRA